MFTKKHLKEVVFEYFDEIEHYKINKGFTKATFEQLAWMYGSVYKLGYQQALMDCDDALTNLDRKLNKEKK